MAARKMTSTEQLQPVMANNAPAELLQSFNQLSLATGASSPLSPSLSQSPSPFRRSDRSVAGYELPQSPLAQHHHPAPRRIPSSSSLRDERRGSAHSLKKRVSSSSLRADQNANSSNSPRPSLSRRSSTQYLSPRASLVPPEKTVSTPTAASIAAEHFAKEVALHQSTELNSNTLVIIQDACYGHRYSRPRTSKAGLELIVERPERMLASVLGTATAYIRLGKRYGRNTYAPHPDLDLRLLPPPPFQIRKTSRSMPLNSPAVTHVHGVKWMDEMKVMCDAAESRLALNGKELVRPSSRGKDDSTSPSKLHEGDLYLCSESLNAFEGALGGVCEAIDSVFGPTSTQRAFVCIRPPGHHCSADYPSGFCWLNNVHVGISYAAMTHGLTHAAILDFDLHHGDGSQAIAWEQNRKAFSAGRNTAQHKKTAIGYFSLHDINSYPCEGGDEEKVRNASVCVDNAHGQSIWNVHLEPWKTPQDFWELYEKKYSILFEKTRSFLRAHTQQLLNSPNSALPKAAIFISAGFDASEWEGVGMQRHKVNVPTDFYARFTADVVKLSREEGLAVDGRVISVLEGGYSDRALTSGVLSHLSGLSDSRGGTEPDDDGSRLAAEMYHRLGISNENKQNTVEDLPVTFDTEWWELPLLEELEALVRPPPPAAARKSREKSAPTFFAPTQASSAKIVSSVRDRKSISLQQLNEDEFSQPQLPEVDWTMAAFEMSKVLIPTDRQTLSWQHAELKAEGARARRDATNVPAVDTQRRNDRGYMQLRERKVKTPPETNSKARHSRTSSVSTRRTTIATVNDLPAPTAADPSSSSDDARLTHLQASRRLSVASTVASAVSAPGYSRRESSRAVNSSNKNQREDPRGVKQSRPVSRAASTVSSVRPSPRKPPMPSRTSSKDKTGTSARKPSPSKGQNQDDGGLATGMKKLRIKLNVPSPEENAIREARAAEERKKNAPRSSSSKPSRASSASRSDSKISRPKSAGNRQQRQPSPGPAYQDNPIPNENGRVVSHNGREYDNTTASRDPLTISLPTDIGDSSLSSHVFADVDFKGSRSRTVDSNGSADHAAIPSPPLTPNQVPTLSHPQITVKSPPESSSHAQHLPVFTPTSIIPFAPGRE